MDNKDSVHIEFNELLDGIDVIDIKPTESIIFRFDANKRNIEDVQNISMLLDHKFPYNNIICFPNDCSLDVFTKDELLNWIDRIKELIEKTWEN